ncbi:MAG: hypothetical protein WCI73_12565 [Phycisphaerae bacterium]
MNKREIAFVVLVVLLAALALAFYPTAPRGEIVRPTVADWSTVTDDPAKRLTLSWTGPPVFPTARKGTWIEANLEQRFNVDFQPVFMDWRSFQSRRSLMFSGGDISDVSWDGDPLPLRRYIKHGLTLEIPYEVILKYAPNYVKLLNRIGRVAWLYSSYAGHNYGLPTFGVVGAYSCPGVWRMDWLRKVGISKVPETVAEMHTALLKIHQSDPSGTGVGSVSGMCPVTYWSVMFVDVFSAHNILPADFILRDGKVVWGGVQPEAKQVLTLLRQWYLEGLIDPDFVAGTTGANLADDKFTNGKTAYLDNYKCWDDFDLTNPNSFYSKMRQIYPTAELAPSAALIGPDGKHHGRVWGGGGNIVWFGAKVAQHPEKVIRVLRMFEAYAIDPQLYIESRMGKRGLHWEWSPQRGIYMLPPYDQPEADTRNLIAVRALEVGFGFYSCCSAPSEFTRALLPAGKEAFRQRYGNPEWGIQSAIGKSDTAESAGDYLEDLWQYQMTNYIQFIRGDRPLREFDDYVKEWNQRGGAQMTHEANAKYRELQKISRLVGADDPGGGP